MRYVIPKRELDNADGRAFPKSTEDEFTKTNEECSLDTVVCLFGSRRCGHGSLIFYGKEEEEGKCFLRSGKFYSKGNRPLGQELKAAKNESGETQDDGNLDSTGDGRIQ